MRTINVLIIGTLSLLCSVANAQPRYSVRVISEQGTVSARQTGSLNLLGATYFDDPNRIRFAAVWDSGKLGVRYGYYDERGPLNTNGYAVNKFGDLVGSADIIRNSDYHAALWTTEGNFIDLGTLGGRDSAAYDITDDRWVVGDSSGGKGIHPFVWHDGQMQDIGILGFGKSSYAYAINEKHQVVGMEYTQEGDSKAWIWDPVFGLRAMFDFNSAVRDINDLGEAVGPGYVWKDTNIRYIGGWEAYAINNRSEIVGTMNYFPGDPAYWDPGGKMYDLNKLVLPGSGFTIDAAYDINDYGQIVAVGRNKDGVGRTLLLTPIRPQVVP